MEVTVRCEDFELEVFAYVTDHVRYGSNHPSRFVARQVVRQEGEDNRGASQLGLIQ